MSLKNHIFAENIDEIEKLIKLEFENGLNEKFGHSNFPFSIKNINIKKFKRVSAVAVFDERTINEKSEINYSGLAESRKVTKSDIDAFSYERNDCVIGNVNKSVEYRVENTNQTQSCDTCRGQKQITCSGCNGRGKNRCGTCNGRREVKCSNCNGRGETTCSMLWGCGGKGTKKENRNGRQVSVPCTSCNGRGVNPCNRCSTGYITCTTCSGNGEVQCRSCNSTGKVDCYSCDAQGSFTHFLSVKSTLVKREKALVVEGNNPGDFIHKKIVSEEYVYNEDFTQYQIVNLKEYIPQLKELLSSLKPKNNQKGTMIYSSYDECASMTFDIIIGESTYLGSLKNGEIWFDNSIMNLLFYDTIDGMKVDPSFSIVLKNKAAFEGNLSDTDVIWESINEYNELEELIDSNKSTNAKITESRKFNLLDVKKYLAFLYRKFFRAELLRNLIFTAAGVFLLIVMFGGDGALLYYGYSDYVFIPICSFLLATSLAYILIKSWSPQSVTLFSFCLIGVGLGYTGFELDVNSDEFSNYLYQKEQEKIEYDLRLSAIENFNKFKKNKRMFSASEFDDLNSLSNNRVNLFDDSKDSVIIIKPSESLKYSFFLEPGVEYSWRTNAHCSSCGRSCYGHDKVTKKRLGLNIGYENFIQNSGYYHKYRVTIGDWAGISDYEVNPNDIKFDVWKFGVSIMNNTLDDFTNNTITDVFFTPEAYLKIFPNSELVNENHGKQFYFDSEGNLQSEYLNNSEDTSNVIEELFSDKMGYINANNLNFRSEPKIDYNIISKLHYGQEIEILSSYIKKIKDVKNCLVINDISVNIDGLKTIILSGKMLDIVEMNDTYIVCSYQDEQNGSSEILQFDVDMDDVDLINEERWYKIKVDNNIGYLYQKFVTPY